MISVQTCRDGNGDTSPLDCVAFAFTLRARRLDQQTSAIAVAARRPHHKRTRAYCLLYNIPCMLQQLTGSVAEWLACWTQVQKGLGSNRSRDAVLGKLFTPIVPLFIKQQNW